MCVRQAKPSLLPSEAGSEGAGCVASATSELGASALELSSHPSQSDCSSCDKLHHIYFIFLVEIKFN